MLPPTCGEEAVKSMLSVTRPYAAAQRRVEQTCAYQTKRCDKRVTLGAVKLNSFQHRFFSEYEILFEALSLLPDSVRIASFESRIFVTYATAWWPINCSTSSLISKLGPATKSYASRLLPRPRQRSVQARQHNWPASRRLARTVLATL